MENPFTNTEDKLLFAKILDKYKAAEKRHTPTYTDFLDPIRCAAFMQVLERMHSDIEISAVGGYPDAERKIITFACNEPPITSVAITFNSKFSKAPTHRDYLGSVLGLGIDRGKVGDVRLGEDGAVLYVLEDIAPFVVENLTQVGRVTVKATMDKEIDGIEATGKTKRINVPSMRLDAVIGSALNLSRGKAATLIESEKVFVNWKQAKKTHTIAVGDKITVRGVGRIEINSVDGTTKKDRIVLTVTI